MRKAKEELECQYEELEALDRMKDGLLSDVSHELMTPVAKLWMQVELLKRFLKDKILYDDYSKIIETMEQTIERQERDLHAILDLSRLEKGGRKYQNKSFRLDQLLHEVLNDYQSTLESSGVVVETALPAIKIVSDKEMLSLVFANLVNNAIKYKSQKVSPKLGVFLEKLPEKVVIKVVDNGIGLIPKEKKQAFERFYQASASAPGSGIGLTIAQRINKLPRRKQTGY